MFYVTQNLEGVCLYFQKCSIGLQLGSRLQRLPVHQYLVLWFIPSRVLSVDLMTVHVYQLRTSLCWAINYHQVSIVNNVPESLIWNEPRAVSNSLADSLYYFILLAKIATGTNFALTNYKVKRDRRWCFSLSLSLSPSLLWGKNLVYLSRETCAAVKGGGSLHCWYSLILELVSSKLEACAVYGLQAQCDCCCFASAFSYSSL